MRTPLGRVRGYGRRARLRFEIERHRQAFGQFDRFVDRDAIGRFGIQDFIGPETEHVAVRRRHPLEAPVIGRLRQQRIEFASIPPDAGHERAGKIDQFIRTQPRAEESLGHFRGHTRIDVVLIQDLKDHFSCSTAARHLLVSK